ncbi:gluconokinase [Rhizobium alvei]|uniref:Gluconokinase n=1 Tax=Rhizobium alvei TaxID=1132659 RepID=A0ABT8YS35_9HYPH|nr:gluconokinase [Rhizobium alvei]MDO6966552.1 gluconokinase [Rhizobium alvei]
MSTAVSQPVSEKAQPWAIVVMGVSGCGKSSVGRAIGAALKIDFVEGDELHPPANIDKMSNGIPLTDEDRWPWLDRIGQIISNAQREGRSVVVSCSSLRKAYRDRLRHAGRVLFVYLEGSEELLTGRMSRREGHFMPVSLLKNQLAVLEPPKGEPSVLAIDISGSSAEVKQEAIAAVAAFLNATG